MSQLVDGNVVEDVVVDGLLEIGRHGVDVAQNLVLQAALVVGDEQVDQFGDFDRFGRFVVPEHLFLDVLVDSGEEVAQRAPGRIDHIGLFVAIGTTVVVGDVHLIGDAQMIQYLVQLFGVVIKDDLFERFVGFGDVFRVVVSGTEVKDVSAVDLMPYIAVIDVLFAAENLTDGMAVEGVGLNSVPVRLCVLHDRGLLQAVGSSFWHNFEFCVNTIVVFNMFLYNYTLPRSGAFGYPGSKARRKYRFLYLIMQSK